MGRSAAIHIPRGRRLANGLNSRMRAKEDRISTVVKDGFKNSGLFTVLVSTGVSLLVAIAASATTIITTQALIEKDRLIQEREIENQQRKDARAKRETVYRTYLDAANGYAVAANHLLDRCSPPPYVPLESLAPICPTYGEFNSARAAYQGALNDIYIFGTAEAVRAARTLSVALPPGLVSGFSDVQIERPQPQVFRVLYASMQDRACLDLRIDPEQPCL